MTYSERELNGELRGVVDGDEIRIGRANRSVEIAGAAFQMNACNRGGMLLDMAAAAEALVIEVLRTWLHWLPGND